MDFKDDEDGASYKNGRWEKNEHHKFLKGCLLYGNNWKKVIFYYKNYKIYLTSSLNFFNFFTFWIL